ncbi:BglG family transcription antiterminator [Lactiplantibacillus daowaiensis]|uniref:BglG family transcription antiterminator n=1 Tax=Lactiplantibacillus daowaiensis TaxID=2559918 RepID=A0ABW1S1D6_9LACO|nr:PTS sugar transporter subunit IIA [Lactiplantibacillus daowaiensis]
MNTGLTLTARQIKITHLIRLSGKTHAQTLAQQLNVSARTVATEIDIIAHAVPQLGLTLVRRPNDGIYFEGPMTALDQLEQQLPAPLLAASRQRQRLIVSWLLLQTDPITIQALADQLFVSKSTVNNDLRLLRPRLSSVGLSFERSQAGLLISGPALTRFNLAIEQMTALTKRATGLSLVVSKQQLAYRYQLPTVLKWLFQPTTVTAVEQVLNQFLNTVTLTLMTDQLQLLGLTLLISQQYPPRFMPATSVEHERTATTKTLLALAEPTLALPIATPFICQLDMQLRVIKQQQLTALSTPPTGELLITVVRELMQDQPGDAILINELAHFLTWQQLKRRPATHSYAQEIKSQFPVAFDQAVNFSVALADRLQIQLCPAAITEVTLYFEAYLERQTNVELLTAVLVCGQGPSYGQLLLQRIHHYFYNQISIIKVISDTTTQTLPANADIIISTIPIKHSPQPLFTMSPLLTPGEITNLQNFIAHQTINRQINLLTQLLSPDSITIDNTVKTRHDALELLSQRLVAADLVDDQYPAAVKTREKLASTALGWVAIPHAAAEHVRHSGIEILISANGIKWDAQTKVHLVLLLAIQTQDQYRARELYHFVNQLVARPQLIQSLTKTQSSAEVLAVLQQLQTNR